MALTNAVVLGTLGAKRTGKSYRRGPWFIIREFIPDKKSILYTTIPLEMAEICEYCSKIYKKPIEEVAERLNQIDAETIKSWLAPEFLPGTKVPNPDSVHPMDWMVEQAKKHPGKSLHFQFDEVHKYGGKKHSPAWRAKFPDVLGEIGHMNVTVEFLSQHWGKVCDEIHIETDLRYEIRTLEAERIPWARISLGSLWQFWAKLTGRYMPLIEQIEMRLDEKKRWQPVNRSVFRRVPFYYKFYDGYASPLGEGVKGEAEEMEWERYSWFKFIIWFIDQNLQSLLMIGGVTWFVWWAFVAGGCTRCTMDFSRQWTDAMKEEAAAYSSSPAEKTTTTQAMTSGGEPNKNYVYDRGVTPNPATTKGVEQATPEALAAVSLQLEKMELVLDERDEKLSEANAELDKLKNELGRLSSVVLIASDHVILTTGQTVELNQTLDWGPYEGLTLEAIDTRERTATFLDKSAGSESKPIIVRSMTHKGGDL